MSDPFLGEIRMFGGNFPPRQWAFCNGTLLEIANYNALFSLIGTIYGGDGRSTFALPDMRGRIPLHYGTGPGLTPRLIGSKFGTEQVQLSISEIPSHNHSIQASKSSAQSSNPGQDLPASQIDGDQPYTSVPTDPARFQTMSSETVSSSGGSQQHYNMMPYQSISFIICINGLYPPRN
ncbi:phage tail protein [Aliikangiella maris]|uniref:Tail fiber protein n=2 Tax=Aliikangiella maris TaxID=3162458 RepID=A0ABV3MNA5_9GAMM